MIAAGSVGAAISGLHVTTGLPLSRHRLLTRLQDIINVDAVSVHSGILFALKSRAKRSVLTSRFYFPFDHIRERVPPMEARTSIVRGH